MTEFWKTYNRILDKGNDLIRMYPPYKGKLFYPQTEAR